jgi:hypothetical protein
MTSKAIQSFPRYTISDKCEIYDTKNERVVKQQNGSKGYKQISFYDANNIKKTRKVHRLMYEVFGLIEGEIMPDEIDHINGKKDNNLINNLRPATRQEQARNTKIPKTNQLGYKNIRITPSGSYQVRIKITADVTYHKNHKTLQEAIDDATRVRTEHFGIFANHG